MPAKKSSNTDTVVNLKPIAVGHTDIKIIGDAELIVHAWSEKAKLMMLNKQMGVANEKRPKKNPFQDYEDSKYKLPDGRTGVPATAFKAAIVGGCRLMDGLPMTQAKVAVRVESPFIDKNGQQIVVIEGTPRMREDSVRLETGVADLRYRAGYPKWRAILRVTYAKNLLTLEQIAALVNASGFCGICEWRPSAPKSPSGSFGTFHIASDQEWKAWKDYDGPVLLPIKLPALEDAETELGFDAEAAGA